MALTARHPISLAIILAAVTAMVGVFVFARPQYHRDSGGKTIVLPTKRPARDAHGAAGWDWQDGTPGWKAGERIDGYLMAGVQPVELESAQLAAARAGLDADGVRVLTSIRGSSSGVLAILAAPTLYETPVKTCLAAVLQGAAPVRWRCPADAARSPVLVAATRFTWTYRGDRAKHPLYLAGVARGDVHRVVLRAAGLRETLYTRGSTGDSSTQPSRRPPALGSRSTGAPG
jgi:hypothetical protein